MKRLLSTSTKKKRLLSFNFSYRSRFHNHVTFFKPNQTGKSMFFFRFFLLFENSSVSITVCQIAESRFNPWSSFAYVLIFFEKKSSFTTKIERSKTIIKKKNDEFMKGVLFHAQTDKKASLSQETSSIQRTEKSAPSV